VSAALTAAQLPLMEDPIISAAFPCCKTLKSLPRGSSTSENAAAGTIAVHAPLLEWDAQNRCTGRILW